VASDTAESRPLRGRLNTVYWLLLTSLLSIPLITPLLRWTAVACTHDGHLHYHRVAAMAHAWENGVYLTRWLPDLAFGYGYPFFIYREAAPLYAVLLPHLAGLPLPSASNLFYALTILFSGIFMFLWVRDLFGPRAALVSAVAYMASPYVLIDALVRGNAPESLALPLLPLILWTGRRWVLNGSVWSFIGGTLGLALLSFSHNISTFIFAPTLLVYLLTLVIFVDRRGAEEQESKGERALSPAPLLPRSPALIRAFSLVIFGLGLAFFYTGGALLEMDQVTLEMSTTTRNNDWRFNFATVGEILAPVPPEDPALVNPPLLLRLGWAPMLLASVGLTGLVWIRGDDLRAREQRLHIWLMVAAVALYLFMALPISRPLWEALPLIDFVQFPWRFVGRAALPVAFLAGVPFYYFDRGRQTTDHGIQKEIRSGNSASAVVRGPWPVVLMVAAISLLILEAIPNLYPRYCAEEPFPTIQAVFNYEHLTGLVGVDPEGSYFPRTVHERPASSPLEADYSAGRNIRRFDETVLPPGATIQSIAYGPLRVTVTLDSPSPFTARYLSFAFPGWSARIDGETVPITPEDPSGLITFEVPAGTHEIVVKWGATPLRLALVGLSVLSAVGIIAVAIWARRSGQVTDRGWAPAGRIQKGELIALALMAVALLAVKVWLDRGSTPLRDAAAPPVEHTTTFQGGALRLDGFNLSRETVPAGETFDIDLAWTATTPPTLDYQSEITLVGPDGLAWSQKGTERPRVYEDAPPTRLWSPGEWGWDSREVRVLSGTPPGQYDIVLTLFDKATLAPATLTTIPAGERVGPSAVIGHIEVANPPQPPQFEPQYPAEQDFPALGLRLLGYNQDRQEVAPGDSILLTLFWECTDTALCDRFALRLAGEDGATAEEWWLPTVREGFPSEAWPDHGWLRGQHAIPLPAGLASGRYRFWLGDFPLGEIAVTAPERQFTSPPLARELGDMFVTADDQPVATLTGLAADYSQSPCSRTPLLPCSISLVWRAEAETPTSYHVFVHLVDESGNILAQSDAVPANWTRPTTGWLPGEYIIDNHTLVLPDVLPADGLSLRVGLYDPDTEARLRTGSADYATIPIGPAN
jgi:hypothetical protein